MASSKRKLVSIKDAASALLLAAFGIVTLVLPVGRWFGFCRTIGAVAARLPVRGHRADALALRRTFPDDPRLESIGNTITNSIAMYLEVRLQVMDQNLLRRWQPDIRVSGTEKIAAGLEAGRGVMLWITPFAYSDLISKMGLAQAGYFASQLSRPTHGFSDTRLGISTLNILRTGVEDRYLHSRIPVDDGTERAAMLTMQRMLRDNRIVAIRAGAQARKPATIALGSEQFRIAVGAIRLSQKTGARLLPVFAVAEDSSTFHVTIESSICDSDIDMQVVLDRYAALLPAYVARHPVQWRGVRDCVSSDERR